MGDEVVTATINLDRCKELRENVFNFPLHRRPDDYVEICAKK
jgi:predicted amidohydrolase